MIEFAEEILRYNYSISQLEIDDKWTVDHGDLKPDPEKFENMKEMSVKLHEMGIAVTIWTHPFFNIESQTLQKSLPSVSFTDTDNPDSNNEYEYYIKSGNPYNKQPGMIKWWNGYGCHLDPFNQAAGEWYNERHINMTEQYGIDSFKFDAGEIVWFPDDFNFAKDFINPSQATHEYVEIVSAPEYRDRIEVRAVYRNQNQPILG